MHNTIKWRWNEAHQAYHAWNFIFPKGWWAQFMFNSASEVTFFCQFSFYILVFFCTTFKVSKVTNLDEKSKQISDWQGNQLTALLIFAWKRTSWQGINWQVWGNISQVFYQLLQIRLERLPADSLTTQGSLESGNNCTFDKWMDEGEYNFPFAKVRPNKQAGTTVMRRMVHVHRRTDLKYNTSPH